MHGVQPSPKTAPSSGAPTRPARGRQDSLALARAAAEEEEQAITMTAAPPIRISVTRCRNRPRPAVVRKIEERMNTTVKPSDEEQRAQHQPPTGPSLQRHVGQPRHVAEEAGHEGQHARRGERHQPGQQGDKDRQREGAGGDRRAGVEYQTGHPVAPESTSSTRPVRVVADTGPLTRAAIRPEVSRTRVVGVLTALPWSERMSTPGWSVSDG